MVNTPSIVVIPVHLKMSDDLVAGAEHESSRILNSALLKFHPRVLGRNTISGKVLPPCVLVQVPHVSASLKKLPDPRMVLRSVGKIETGISGLENDIVPPVGF